MMKKGFGTKPESKVLVLSFVIAASVLIALYAAFVAHITIVYTHLFYIPILLAGMWYKKKAVAVALFLGIVHILVTHFSPPPLTVNEFARVVIFVLVAYVIGLLSEQRAKGEDTLLESEEKYRELAELLPEVIFETNLEGTITYANKVAFDSFGYTQSDFDKGLNALQMLIPEDRDRGKEHIQRGFSGEKIGSIEYTAQRKDKTTFPVIINSNPIIRETKPVGLRGVITDITERKRTEEERERLLKELEAKSTELERFAHTVSHDLRSPLVTIQGFTDMVQTDLAQNEVEKAKDNLKFIDKAAITMDKLLSATLQLSRAGRVMNPPEDVPFGAIVKDALEQTAGEIKAKNIEVSVAEDFSSVHVDRMRIAEVLVNLIANSINYRGEQPSPKIEIGHRIDNGERVFYVQDNGIGIDPGQHEKVFDLFYQVDTSGKKGTGAGLAIVKRIIEVHNGRIWIESEKGKGCTVCFTLPVV